MNTMNTYPALPEMYWTHTHAGDLLNLSPKAAEEYPCENPFVWEPVEVRRARLEEEELRAQAIACAA